MRELRETKFRRAVDLFYEAAACPALWPAALDDYADAVGAEGMLLIPGPAAAMAPLCSASLEEPVRVGVRDGWFSQNPRVSRGIPALRDPAGVITESHIFTREELDRVPFNADFVGRQGLRWFAGIYLVPAGDRSIMLSAERRAGQEMFSHREIEMMAAIVPHLQGAGQLAVRLAETRAAGTLEAFDLMQCGAVLLDGVGRVIRHNASMSRHLGDALLIARGALLAAQPAANAALGRLVAGAIRQGPALDAPAPGVIALPRPSGPPLAVRAMPLVASAGDVFQQARAIVLVTDPADGVEPSAAFLRQAYGLTPAETRLALELARGCDLREIGERRRVSVATLRIQLKSIFAKTGTHRQGELVALLLRTAGRCGPP